LQLIAKRLRLGMDQIEEAQEKHLIDEDLTFVLGVEEFLSSNVPAWLSGEKALQIYQEIKDLTMGMVDEEQQRQGGRKIDLYDGQDEEGEVIK
jgi:hypothetical protein